MSQKLSSAAVVIGALRIKWNNVSSIISWVCPIYVSFFSALEAQSKLGGEELIPFYGLLDGGRDGELFAELEDYFYYAQIRR